MKMVSASYKSFLLAICIVFAGQTSAEDEFFTATAEMEQLLKVLDVLIPSLKQFITDQESKLSSLQKQINNYVENHEIASKNISAYLANPINAFLMVKRLTRDWEEVEALLSINASEAVMESVNNQQKTLKFPSNKDLIGAAKALTRIQETYDLKAKTIADGEINGINYNSKMSAEDCYELGLQAFLNQNYKYSTQWLKESLDRLTGDADSRWLRFDILGYLALSYYEEENFVGALDVTEELLQIVPFDQVTRNNKKLFQEKLATAQDAARERAEVATSDYSEPEIERPPKVDAFIYDDYQRNLYKQTCRQELQPSPKELAHLQCRYVTNKHKFLTIAPFKLEEASLDPYIVTYHDVLSNTEIEQLKTVAMPLLKTAKVSFPDQPDTLRTEIRTGKLAWLPADSHKIIGMIDQRVADMTGLSMISAEPLQVLNYGVGGHYEPHFDWDLGEPDAIDGDRIGTVLFYMSEVIQGGATVFPLINVTLLPRKGSAAFWYNLHTTGKGDLRTKHAACPVLIGSKWVSNKWIHERGQEFLAQCDLEIDHPEDRNDYFNEY